MDKVHRRIKEIRKETGYTQQQMADMMDVERTTYINFENGKTNLSKHLERFIEITGSSAAEIFSGGPVTDGYLQESSIFDRLGEISDQLQEIKYLILSGNSGK